MSLYIQNCTFHFFLTPTFHRKAKKKKLIHFCLIILCTRFTMKEQFGNIRLNIYHAPVHAQVHRLLLYNLHSTHDHQEAPVPYHFPTLTFNIS